MGSLSNYAESKVLGHVLKTAPYTPPSTVYVGMSTADPGEDGSGLAEPVGNGYARKPISFGAAANRVIAQDTKVSFDEATGSWGTISHYPLFDAPTGGNMIAYGSRSPSDEIIAGEAPYLSVGEVAITINTGNWSNYMVNAALNWLFDGGAFPQPTNLYVGVGKSAITDAMTGATADELSMIDYARQLVNSWDAVVDGVSANTNEINFGVLTGPSETGEALVVFDALTGGNLLIYTNAPTQTIQTGRTLRIIPGGFGITLD